VVADIFTARQTVRLASYAERCISLAMIDSARPSVTRWYHAKMTPATIMRYSLIFQPHESSFLRVNFSAKFQREHRERGRQMRGGRKNRQFLAKKSPYLRNGAR